MLYAPAEQLTHKLNPCGVVPAGHDIIGVTLGLDIMAVATAIPDVPFIAIVTPGEFACIPVIGIISPSTALIWILMSGFVERPTSRVTTGRVKQLVTGVNVAFENRPKNGAPIVVGAVLTRPSLVVKPGKQTVATEPISRSPGN